MDKLFTLIQLTREQAQYGYGISGINRFEQSNLAEHQYLVSFITWQIARHVNNSGGNINTLKAVEIALTHDLGELFGGDLNFHYARVNPDARVAAKNFEVVNQKFLSEFFGPDKEYFNELSAENMQSSCDEAILAKIADYVECLYFKKHRRKITKNDMPPTIEGLKKQLEGCTDTNKKILGEFISNWEKEFNDKQISALIWEKKK